jgi:hypothetical protein
MKTFIFRYSTNYNLGIVVIVEDSLEKAKKLALEAGAWDTNDVTIIDSNTKRGIILDNASSNSF